MPYFNVTDICWDTDGESVPVEQLPVDTAIEAESEDQVVDELSDAYGCYIIGVGSISEVKDDSLWPNKEQGTYEGWTEEQVEQHEKRLERIRGDLQSLLNKKRLTLTVELSTLEDADEIMGWMYSTNRPMKSKLLEISWAEENAVTKDEMEFIAMARKIFGNKE